MSAVQGPKAVWHGVATGRELEAAIGRYEPEDGLEILAEEFADIKHEYSLLGISTDSLVEALGLFRVAEGGSRERKGVALTGKMIAVLVYRIGNGKLSGIHKNP